MESVRGQVAAKGGVQDFQGHKSILFYAIEADMCQIRV